MIFTLQIPYLSTLHHNADDFYTANSLLEYFKAFYTKTTFPIHKRATLVPKTPIRNRERERLCTILKKRHSIRLH